MKRKISACLNVRINVGNYQHIELVNHAEEEIEFGNDAERITKEDQLFSDLATYIVRAMRSIPAKLGKGIENAQQVEEAIQKAIPDWLAKGPVPNIANQPRVVAEKVAAEQKDNAASVNRVITEDKPVVTKPVEKPLEKPAGKPATPVAVVPVATPVSTPATKPTAAPVASKPVVASKPAIHDDLFDE